MSAVFVAAAVALTSKNLSCY